MAKISGKETRPEIFVRKFLFAKGFRYRKNVPSLPGKPDIVLRKYRTVVFIHGCFWHGHDDCPRAKLPKTRSTFWRQKIAANSARDKENAKLLMEQGWNVITIWQCEITVKHRTKRLDTLTNEIRDQS